MFIVTILGKKYLFVNKKTDDFLRLLPEQFECKDSDISAEYIDEDDQRTFRNAMRLNPDKGFRFNPDTKTFFAVTAPKFKPGEPNPNNILNKQPKADTEPAGDQNAITKAQYTLLSDAAKIAYLKSVTWVPRLWELNEYKTIIGTDGTDVVFNADSNECKESVETIVVVKTKRVDRVVYTTIINPATGQPTTVMSDIIFKK